MPQFHLLALWLRSILVTPQHTLAWLRRAAWVSAVLAAGQVTACKDSENAGSKGKLIVATQTDMGVPGGIDQIELRVTFDGQVRQKETFTLPPDGDAKVPLVVTLDSGSYPSGDVTISIVGKRGSKAQVFAQTVTQVPTERTALVEMPLEFLCLGSANETDDFAESACEDIKGKPAACVAGECKPVAITESNLPDYQPGDVFGGAEGPEAAGACFDTQACFTRSLPIEPNEDCIVELDVPDDREPNVALLLSSDIDAEAGQAGICGLNGCLVPLQDDDRFGYTAERNDDGSKVFVQLPKAVCTKLANEEIEGLVGSVACQSKTTKTPTCGPWSSTGNPLNVTVSSLDPETTPEAGVSDASVDADTPAQLDVQIVPVYGWDGGNLVPGQTVQLVLEGVPPDAPVVWASSDESVAVVDEHGQVTIVGPGSAVITATIDGIVAEWPIMVATDLVVDWVASVTSLMVDPAAVTLPQGASAPVTVRATLEDGTTLEATNLVQWTSADPDVATVDNGRIWGNNPGETTLTAELNQITAVVTVTVSDAKLDLLYIDPDYTSLPAGLTTQLTVTGVYEDGTSLDLTPTVVWSSSDPEVADVDEQGLVTTHAEGDVVITAELDGRATEAVVRVTDAALLGLTVAPDAVALLVGQSEPLTALASFSDGQTVDVTSQASWSAANNETVELNGNQVLGMTPGTAQVTAEFGDLSASTTVTVRAAEVVSLTLAPEKVTLPLGTRTALAVEATFEDGSSQDVTDDAAWTTSDPNVGTVLEDGFFVTAGEGTVTISATFAGLTATSEVSVSAATLLALTLLPDSLTLIAGRTGELHAWASYSDGTTVEVTNYATWVSDASVASVNAGGVVRGNSKGNATVTASYFDKTATATIAVTDAELVAIAVFAEQTSTPVGESLQLTAEASYSDGTTLPATNDVTWTSDDLDVASVAANGLVTGKSPGEVTVSAQLQGFSGEVDLEIIDAVVTGVTLSPESVSLPKGTSVLVKATAEYSDGTSHPVGSGAVWSTDTPGVATVSGGEVRGVNTGKAIVTLALDDFSDTVEVTVTDAVPTGLTVSAAVPSAPKGVGVQFSAQMSYSDGTSAPADNVTWKSLTPSTASVDASGQALGLAQGAATIQGSSAGFAASASFDVTPATISQLVVSPESNSTPVGLTVTFLATAVLTDGSTTPAANVSWTSSDPLVASITGGQAKGIKSGNVTITATVNGVYSDTATLEVTQAVVSSVAISPTTPSIPLGTGAQFTATATYTDGSTKGVAATFSSDATNVLVINTTSGAATSKAVGTANVTATFGGKSGTTLATVTDAVVTAVTISPDPASVPVGQTVTLVAKADYSDGHTVDVTKDASWASQAADKASVQGGVVTGKATGDAPITATYKGQVGSLTVKVTSAVVQTVSIEADVTSLALGTTTQMRARAFYSDGSSKLVTNEAIWTRTAGTSVSVNLGLVQGIGTGKSTVSAKFNNIEGLVDITVTSAVVTAVTINPLKDSVIVGNTVTFAATAIYSDNTSQSVTAGSTWTTGNGAIASVTTGVAKGVGPGETTIKATYQGFSATATLTVLAASVIRVDITGQSTSMPAGRTLQLAATAVYDNGTSVDVTKDATWRSGNTAIVTVESGANGGKVKGVAAGSTRIYAKFSTQEGGLTITVTSAVLESIRTAPGSLTLVEGLSGSFALQASYSDGTTQDVTSSTTWTSNDTNVATFTAPGKVLAVKTGTTNVKAVFSGLSVESPVTVNKPDPVRLEVKPATVSLPAGTNTPVSVTVYWNNDTSSDATTLVTWASTNGQVATVSADKKLIQAGTVQSTATLTATYLTVSATSVVTVTSPALKGLIVDPATATVTVGLSVQLKAIGTLTDNTTVDLTGKAKWTSANTSSATVSASGLVTGVQTTNSVVITADYQGTPATANVTVVAAKVTGVRVVPDSFSVQEQKTFTLVAWADYDNGQSVNVTSKATWASDNTNVLSFNSAGVVQGLHAGETTVSATFEQVKGAAKGVVTPVPPARIDINPSKASVVVNGTFKLQARAFDAAGTYLGDYSDKVKWVADDKYVKVDATGTITGLVVTNNSIVTATYDQLPEATCVVTVVTDQLPIEKMEVYPSSASVVVGVPYALIAMASLTDGSIVDISNKVTWSSDNKDSIPVDEKTGVVTAAKADASAGIIATYGQFTAKAAVRSISADPYLEVSPNVFRLIPKGTAAGHVYLVSGGDRKDVTSSVKPSTSNTKIATVAYDEKQGLVVTGIDEGPAMLSVSVAVGRVTVSTQVPISVSTK